MSERVNDAVKVYDRVRPIYMALTNTTSDTLAHIHSGLFIDLYKNFFRIYTNHAKNL